MGGPRRGCRRDGLPLQNDARPHFTDVSDPVHITRAKTSYGFTLNVYFDNDDWPDIYVACDSTRAFTFTSRWQESEESAFSFGYRLQLRRKGNSGQGVTAAELSVSGLLISSILLTSRMTRTTATKNFGGRNRFSFRQSSRSRG